jgi:hypothetical protein
MGKHRVLTTTDVMRDTGLSRAWICHLERNRLKGRTPCIPAKRANPGKRNYKWYENAEFARWRKAQKKKPPVSPVRRAYRISQRRQEKIEKLQDILNDQMEVSAEDKKLALEYFRCIFRLWWERFGPHFTERQFPLLEGLHALYESKLIFGHGLDFLGVEQAIERLPTRSETTLQTEQSSLNASAQ